MSELTPAEAYARGVGEGLARHTWMRDGVTYVGNGQYTMREALEMAEQDLGIDLTDEKAGYR